MSNKKQTAVEWLMNDLIERKLVRSETPIKSFLNASLKQAKELEKQQIVDGYRDSRYSLISKEDAEQYYNETFKK